MKQRYLFRILPSFSLYLFLILTSGTSARSMKSRKGHEQLQFNEKSGRNSLSQTEEYNRNELMGVENCETRDEECLERRVASEAHLDYIYTQHFPEQLHKPSYPSP